MNMKNFIILIIAAIIVYFVIKILFIVVGLLFQVAIFLVVTYVLYLFLKNLL